jgi:hypothetical protein
MPTGRAFEDIVQCFDLFTTKFVGIEIAEKSVLQIWDATVLFVKLRASREKTPAIENA